jgi:hypothetical protein
VPWEIWVGKFNVLYEVGSLYLVHFSPFVFAFRLLVFKFLWFHPWQLFEIPVFFEQLVRTTRCLSDKRRAPGGGGIKGPNHMKGLLRVRDLFPFFCRVWCKKSILKHFEKKLNQLASQTVHCLGLQIYRRALSCPGLPDYYWCNIPERVIIHHITTKLPNGLTVYHTAVIRTYRYCKWPYNNIFHYKVLQNVHKLGFLLWKLTIWQPWPCHWRSVLSDSPWKKYVYCLVCNGWFF